MFRGKEKKIKWALYFKCPIAFHCLPENHQPPHKDMDAPHSVHPRTSFTELCPLLPPARERFSLSGVPLRGSPQAALMAPPLGSQHPSHSTPWGISPWKWEQVVSKADVGLLHWIIPFESSLCSKTWSQCLAHNGHAVNVLWVHEWRKWDYLSLAITYDTLSLFMSHSNFKWLNAKLQIQYQRTVTYNKYLRNNYKNPIVERCPWSHLCLYFQLTAFNILKY